MKNVSKFLAILCILSGCTLSFQNISTEGTATDLIDENQEATPKVSTTVSLPFTP